MVNRKRAEDSFSDQLGALITINSTAVNSFHSKVKSQEISHRTILKPADEMTTQAEDDTDFEVSETTSVSNSYAISSSCAGDHIQRESPNLFQKFKQWPHPDQHNKTQIPASQIQTSTALLDSTAASQSSSQV